MNQVDHGHKLLLQPAYGEVTSWQEPGCYLPAQKGWFEVTFRDEVRSTCSPKPRCPSSCLRAANGHDDAPARTAFILWVLLGKPSPDTARALGMGGQRRAAYLMCGATGSVKDKKSSGYISVFGICYHLSRAFGYLAAHTCGRAPHGHHQVFNTAPRTTKPISVPCTALHQSFHLQPS